MSGKKRENVKYDRNQDVDFSGSFIKVVGEGDLANMQNFIYSHSLSYCESCYVLLCDSIQSGHFEMAKFLVQKGAKVDSATDCVSTPLHFASEQKNVELVRLLLKKNARIDARNSKKETALHIAAAAGCSEIIDLLLKNNASITAQTIDGSTPFVLAAENLHGEVVRMLLKHTCAKFKDENDRWPSVKNGISTPLSCILLCDPNIRARVNQVVVQIVDSLKKDHGQMIDDLIDHGFTLSPEYINDFVLHGATVVNRTKLIKSILTITSPNDATRNLLLLHSAVKKRKESIVDMILSYGSEAKTDKGNEDAGLHNKEDKMAEVVDFFLASGADIKMVSKLLFTFVEKEFVELCRVLIKYGADVNMLNVKGETPLHVSCGLADKKENEQKKDLIVKLLLESGADVNIGKSDCGTPLHHAAWTGRKRAVCILLNFRVDVNLRAKDGSTPLHSASRMGRNEVVQILLRNNADVEAQDEKGWTPLHCAAYRQDEETVKVLLKFGADTDQREFNKETALHKLFSTRYDRSGLNIGIITMLLQNGCDACAKNSKGQTVLDVVVSKAKSYCYDEEALVRNFHLDRNFDFTGCVPWKFWEAVETVIKHLVKLETIGMCQTNPDQLGTMNDLRVYFRVQCEKELTRMKNEKLNPQVTLYDILVSSKRLIYAKNQSLVQTLKSFNFEPFPIYGGLIRGFWQKSESRLTLVTPACISLEMLIKVSNKLNGRNGFILPDELLEHIVTNLDNSDLKSLISCGETLKRQLGL